MIRFILSGKTFIIALTLLLAGTVGTALAAGGSPHGISGGGLSLWWILPFLGILLSIALIPLFAEDFWHRHFGKVSLFWSLTIIIPIAFLYGIPVVLYEVLHTYLLDFIPFLFLLLALFTVAGGIRLTGQLVGTPKVNFLLIIIGTILASWMGTTGAAMLLIRPLLRANEWRKYKIHTVVFFIFLVANIGGCLTPLGDPPLFMGFLSGVHFFWTTRHLLFEMTFILLILLPLYYVIERRQFRKETVAPPEKEPGRKLGIEGGINFILLIVIIGLVLFSGSVQLGHINLSGIRIPVVNIIRDLGMLAVTWLSLYLTKKKNRAANGFDWFPIVEVGKLFAGIFITIIPALDILQAGENGSLSAIINLVTRPDGTPNDQMYFWVTGILSSFLDNTPTYLVFFNTAGGDAATLMTTHASTLIAISCGAVFMGAVSYIGNAPNFMVKSIAERNGVRMPSFLGYIGWSCIILIPTFILFSYIFIYIEELNKLIFGV